MIFKGYANPFISNISRSHCADHHIPARHQTMDASTAPPQSHNMMTDLACYKPKEKIIK